MTTQVAEARIQEGDKVFILGAIISDPVYVIGYSPLDGLIPGGPVVVIGDEEGNAMPIQIDALRLMQRDDLTRARAKRLRRRLIAKMYGMAHHIIKLRDHHE